MSEIKEKVVAIIVDKLGVDAAEVKDEASFTNDLGADSLDTVELIMELEKEFGVTIPNSYRPIIILFFKATASPPALHILRCYQHRTSHRREGAGEPTG